MYTTVINLLDAHHIYDVFWKQETVYGIEWRYVEPNSTILD